MSYSSYLYQITDSQIKETVRWLTGALRDVEFDAIAVRGTSGIVPGAIVSYQLGKILCVVRKPATEKSHAGTLLVEVLTTTPPVELQKPIRYVLLDDCSGTGKTQDDIKHAMKKVEGEWVLTLLYSYKKAIAPVRS